LEKWQEAEPEFFNNEKQAMLFIRGMCIVLRIFDETYLTRAVLF
jgi:hypothetical protein